MTTGVTPAEHHVPGLQAQPDVGAVEHLLDLPGGFHVGPGLGVERGLIATVAAAADHPGQAAGEPAPAVTVQAERALRGRPERQAAAFPAPGVGQGGPRRRAWQVGPDGVERVQQLIQAGQRLVQGTGIGVGQLQVGAGQAEAPFGEQLAEPFPGAEVAGRPEVDARVAGPGHLVEDAHTIGHVRVVAHGDLECAVADRCVRHGDRAGSARCFHGVLAHLGTLR
jgi:hypothetical protein